MDGSTINQLMVIYWGHTVIIGDIMYIHIIIYTYDMIGI
jgi:hypothetical protein